MIDDFFSECIGDICDQVGPYLNLYFVCTHVNIAMSCNTERQGSKLHQIDKMANCYDGIRQFQSLRL